MNEQVAEVGQDIIVGGQAMSRDAAWAAVRRSAHWFWWVAGLSLANSIASAFDAGYSMVLGLGVTQIIDGMFSTADDGTPRTLTMAMQGVHFAIVLVPIAMFYFLGRSAGGGGRIAWVVGMVLYLLDGLLFVLAQDWLAVGFHAFVLFMLWAGYGMLKQVQAAESAPAVAVDAPAEAAEAP